LPEPDQVMRGADDTYFGTFRDADFSKTNEQLESVGARDAVGIEHPKPFVSMGARILEPGLHGTAGAQIQRMSNDGNIRWVGEFCRTVTRSVVDDDDLRHRQGLLHNGFEGGADNIGVIPSVDLNQNPHCRSVPQSVETIATMKPRKPAEAISPPRKANVTGHGHNCKQRETSNRLTKSPNALDLEVAVAHNS
jgi:hypothetical protein